MDGVPHPFLSQVYVENAKNLLDAEAPHHNIFSESVPSHSEHSGIYHVATISKLIHTL